jgi:DNA-binding FadR family transcriptional regulator
MRTRPATLTSRVAADIRRRIEQRRLPPGARLPSIRALADSLGVSKSTVVEAYDRLAAEGLIVARPGSGFYVPPGRPLLSLAPSNPRIERDVDPRRCRWRTSRRGSIGRSTRSGSRASRSTARSMC